MTRIALIFACILVAAGAADAREKTIRSLPDKARDVATSDVMSDGARERAADAYREFLKSAKPNSELRAEALRRLADLELETAEALLLDEAPVSQGKAVLQRAIAGYRQLLAEYPGRAENDRVLYQLARAEEQAGDVDDAQTTLDALVTAYPDTPYAGEAWFRVGESRFLNRRYADAETAYAAVLDLNTDSKFHNASLYKHGWSRFKQEKYAAGLDSFFDLLNRRFGDADNIDLATYTPTEREVLKDTLRAVSLSFASLGGATGIDGFLADRTAPNWTWLLYSGLGDLFLEQERYQDAAEVFGAFVKRDPVNLRAPGLQTQVIDAYQRGGFPREVLRAKETFAERYHTSAPFWQGRDPAAHPDVLSQLKTHLGELAQHYHARFQADSTPAASARAVHWYRQTLSAFPEDPDAPGVNFLLAELLFDSNLFADAATEYARTAYAYLPHEKSPVAGYASVLAMRRQLESVDPADPKYGDWHSQGIEASLRFGSVFPSHPEADRVVTTAAESLFASGDFDRARETSMALVTRSEPIVGELGRTLWTIVAHVSFDRSEYTQAETAYANALSLVGAEAGAVAGADSDASDTQALSERLAASIYKQGEAVREAGDMAAAAGHFLRVAEVSTATAIHPVAAFDAATAFADSGNWVRSAELLEAFRVKYPRHELARDVPRRLASAWLESGDNARAARALEVVAREDTDSTVRRDALWQAASLYETGDESDRIRVYQRVIDEFPDQHDDAMEARQKLAELYAGRGDAAAEWRWLGAIVQADAAAGSARSERSRTLAAHALLKLAAPARDAYAVVQLTAPLADSVRTKKTSLENVVELHTRAADYGVSEVTTQATYHIAEAYREFGRALMDSERPALDADALEEYEFMLEEQAFPFEEKAIDIHTANADRSASQQYDDWIAASFARLAELLPVRYGKSEMSEAYVAF